MCSSDLCPASVQSAVLFPEQGLHPAAEHGVLRLGKQRVAGQQLLRGIPGLGQQRCV